MFFIIVKKSLFIKGSQPFQENFYKLSIFFRQGRLFRFVVKELFQLIAGAVHLKMGKMLPGALMAGKVCTTVLFISLIALVLFPLVDDTVVSVIAAVDAVFLGISFVSYILAYFGKNAKVQDLKSE